MKEYEITLTLDHSDAMALKEELIIVLSTVSAGTYPQLEYLLLQIS